MAKCPAQSFRSCALAPLGPAQRTQAGTGPTRVGRGQGRARAWLATDLVVHQLAIFPRPELAQDFDLRLGHRAPKPLEPRPHACTRLRRRIVCTGQAHGWRLAPVAGRGIGHGLGWFSMGAIVTNNSAAADYRAMHSLAAVSASAACSLNPTHAPLAVRGSITVELPTRPANTPRSAGRGGERDGF